ncbi:hypothetical protein [Tellurirhabdus bombi]|uniref:hypothetical protein n=1 Tax=Tellurirhabdus bombi TaxID=2907205 RepID=UPI001F3309FC|nr:hypothetical protein [Tellurirhabdus bombi]
MRLFQTHDFLLLIRLVPQPMRWANLYSLSVQLLLPVFAYAGFTFWVGSKYQATASQIVVSGVTLLLSLLPPLAIEYRLRHPHPVTHSSRFASWLRQRLSTPYSLFFIRHLLHQEAVSLFLTKLGTLALIAGTIALYPTDDYDLRLFSLAMLVVAAFHAGLVYRLYRFEAEKLLIIRNLPISTKKRLSLYATIFGLLLTPELILLMRNHPIDVSFFAILGTWAFGHSLILGLYTLLLPRHRSAEQFMSLVFVMVILYFFLIMYRLPVYMLSVSSWAAAGILFKRFFTNSAWEVSK